MNWTFVASAGRWRSGACAATACALVVMGCAGAPAAASGGCDANASTACALLEPSGQSASTTEASNATRATGPAGVWYLTADGARYVLALTWSPALGGFEGAMELEGGTSSPLAAVTWDSAQHRLRFRRDDAGFHYWFEADVVEGVMVGRFAHSVSATAPGASEYVGHVTGWSATTLDRDIVPRAWDLRSDDGLHARVRVDRDPSGALVGTLKVYARDGVGGAAEELEHDLDGVSWDGERLVFTVARADATWTFTGGVQGRSLRLDAARRDSAASVTWSGARAEVLSHGITQRSPTELAAWRSRARAQLTHIIMADGPTPTSARVTVLREDLSRVGMSPSVTGSLGGFERQDGYTLTELEFEHTLADPRGGPDIVRRSHAFLARPNGGAPPGGFPLAVAFNGHYGSARAVMTAGTTYWYGDAYARNGYLVLAIDVSHRSLADRHDLYADYVDGDDPLNGNGAHPAIASAGFDTDWEEDGERVWDAMRALDYAVAHEGARSGRVLATGLSMGAEVATLFGALDPRVGAVVAAGFSPDLPVMRVHGNHPCWRWRYADIEEYVDVSDYHALIAPRTLVVETGSSDATFSSYASPFAADKQVLRRSRVAYGNDVRHLVHDLHEGAHTYIVGDPAFDLSVMRGVPVPTVIAPTAAEPLAWQVDTATRLLHETVFDLTHMLSRN